MSTSRAATSRWWRAVAAVALGSLALAGCGGDDEEPQGSASESGPQTVKVGLVPVADFAPIYLGVEKGLFADQDLDVEPVVVETGPAIIAGVTSGELDFGGVSIVPALQAQAQGVPIQVVAPAVAGAESFSAVVVGTGSPIRSPKDLEDKTVAVNALKNVAELFIRAAVDEAGGDGSSVKFTAIPFPDVAAAIGGDRVDAGLLLEPFVTTAMSSGDFRAVIDNPGASLLGPQPLYSTWLTGQRLVEEDRGTVERFAAGVREANAYAQEHPDELRAVLPTFTRIPAEAAKQIKLGEFPTSFDGDQLNAIADLMVKYGFTEEKPDVEAAVFSGGEG